LSHVLFESITEPVSVLKIDPGAITPWKIRGKRAGLAASGRMYGWYRAV
jgi:hypothetical protein